MQQSDKDPDFLSIIIPADYEKNKRNPSYPSCTFRDKNPILCSQFFLCMLIVKSLDERANDISFLNASIAGKTWWGFMKIMFRVTNSNTAAKHFKSLCEKTNVMTDKILHQKSSGLYELTKHAHIMQYAINIVSRHEIDKPFYHYVNWLQPHIFRIMAGHHKDTLAFIVQNVREFAFPIDETVNNTMFMRRQVHLAELNSNDGCQCDCSAHFLNVVLPYVTKVILQDGSYWIVNWPDH